MNVLAGVQEAPGGDGDVLHVVAVERELEFQGNRCRSSGKFMACLKLGGTKCIFQRSTGKVEFLSV